MEEAFLHYIWKFQYLDKTDLQTTEGENVQIFNPGIYNTDSGPDFSNARVTIDGIEWRGNIELHLKSSDWTSHKHQENNAYESVVLHVVYEDDKPVKRKDGTYIPTLKLKDRFSLNLYDKYLDLIRNISEIPCANQFARVDNLVKSSMLDKVLVERLKNKSAYVSEILAGNLNDWEQTAYVLLLKSFGNKLNAEPFSRLARNIPFKILRKHSDQLFQLEALLFGTAGFLTGKPETEYQSSLKKEYGFLKQKYQLTEIEPESWKFMRMRPVSFPTIRIAQTAAIIFKLPNLFSCLLELKNAKEARNLFHITVSEFWQKHYHFHSDDKGKVSGLGKDAVDHIIINAIVPLLTAWSFDKDQEKYREQAIHMLEGLPAESNKITKLFQNLGLELRSAFESQAVLELYNNYCYRKNCLSCSVGCSILK
jgi:hypothetical protein